MIGMNFGNGPVVMSFNNDTVSFLIVNRPKLHAMDVTKYESGMKRGKFVGRYSDFITEWQMKDFLKEKYGLTEDEDDEEGVE